MRVLEVFFRKVNTVVTKPKSLIIQFIYFISPLLSDEIYLKSLFRLRSGYKLNLDNPKSYNEKLQWLKINYNNPISPTLVDKYEYKGYVKQQVGEEYVVKNFGVWNTFDEIDFDKLPNQFVLKTTHDQGGVIICNDKKSFDLNKARKKMNKHLKKNLFYLMRESPYKYVKPRILAEEILLDYNKEDLWDYKFYCFNGEPKYMYISMGRQDKHVPFYTYDMSFNLLELERPGHEKRDEIIEKPVKWDEMISLSRKLSKGFPHVRIDFYIVGDKVYAGEFTLFPSGGMLPFIPQEWDYKFGKLLGLPKKNN